MAEPADSAAEPQVELRTESGEGEDANGPKQQVQDGDASSPVAGQGAMGRFLCVGMFFGGDSGGVTGSFISSPLPHIPPKPPPLPIPPSPSIIIIMILS